MGWKSYTTDTYYEIERIVSAERLPGGWRVMVKWQGYPDPTPEPLSKVLRDTQSPEILLQIEQCKNEYLAKHPSARTMLEREAVVAEPPRPTRVQPNRARAQTDKFTFMIYGANDPMLSARAITMGLKTLQKEIKQRCSALLQFRPDFSLTT